MGLFGRFKEKRQMQVLTNAFRMINGYTPSFTSLNGGLFEIELTRSIITAISTHCSKLNPVITGNAYKYKRFERILQTRPNKVMTMQQFLEKLCNIYETENTAYIVPIYSDISCSAITGIYPVRSIGSRITQYEGVNYFVYKLFNQEYAIELDRVGILRKNYYTYDFMGDGNAPLRHTLDLIHAQNEGIKEGIKNSATIRFLARLTNTIMPEHLVKERKALTEANLQADNNGGIMIFDNKYAEVKAIDSKPFIVNAVQMENIKNNAFNYFHICEDIIQNKASEDVWNAFYEGKIEPFAIQLSQVITYMFFNDKDIAKGIGVTFESSALQFASNKTKLEFVTQMFDRGQLTINQALKVWNLPKVEDGDKRYIRKEYTEVNNLDKEVIDQKEGGENDGTGKEEEPNQE